MARTDFRLSRRGNARSTVVAAAIRVVVLAPALPTSALVGVASASAPHASAKLTGALMRSSPLGPLKRGTVVGSRTVGTRVFTKSQHGFGLATERFGASYPAVTVNSGRTWRINGPVFHVPALQAPFAVTQVGALNARTYYAWGAQSIDATSDGGKHWWRTLVPNSAWRWSQADQGSSRSPRTRRLEGAPATVSVFLSTDGGHHWHITRELQGV